MYRVLADCRQGKSPVSDDQLRELYRLPEHLTEMRSLSLLLHVGMEVIVTSNLSTAFTDTDQVMTVAGHLINVRVPSTLPTTILLDLAAVPTTDKPHPTFTNLKESQFPLLQPDHSPLKVKLSNGRATSITTNAFPICSAAACTGTRPPAACKT